MENNREYKPLVDDDSDAESRDSAMIAAPAARESKFQPKYKNEKPEPINRKPRMNLKNKDDGQKKGYFNFLNPMNLRKGVKKESENGKVKKRRRRKKATKSPEVTEPSTPTMNNGYNDDENEEIEIPESPQLRGAVRFSTTDPVGEEDLQDFTKMRMSRVDKRKLRNVLKDFFAFHDPVMSVTQLDAVLEWADYYGLEQLNKRLKEKYNDDLIIQEDISAQPVSQSPNEPPKAMLMVSVRVNVVNSVRMTKKLVTPGIKPRTKKVKVAKTEVEVMNLRRALTILEDSEGPEEIAENLMDFYRLADPHRLHLWEEGKIRDFVGEVLSWTFRFGVPALINNLKEVYLNEKASDDGEDVVFENSAKTNHKADEWKDRAFIEEALTRFYTVYCPGRLERPLDDLVDYIIREGVVQFNLGLVKRYNDDLFTFENEEHIKWRGQLMDQLFAFFSKVDQGRINQGLTNLINYAERHENSMEALNEYLRKHYGCDLDSYEDL